MTNAENERKTFWKIFHDVLKETGNPFMFTENKYWACINSNDSNWHRTIIAMDFLVQKEIFRINLYINNDIELFDMLLSRKEEIEKLLGFEVKWVFSEKKGNARRIKLEQSFIKNNNIEYKKLIVKSISIINNFVKVFSKYTII